jgi:hypothetical protein
MSISPSGFRLRACKFTLLLFAASLPGIAFANLMPAWLLVSLKSQESIVTTDSSERDKLVEAGWKIDGTGGLQSEGMTGAGPLHRLWRATPNGTERLLETDAAQIPMWVESGYTDEGVVGYVAAAPGDGRVPVYQYRKGDKRLWLADPATQASAKDSGWRLQGVHFWLWPAPAK